MAKDGTTILIIVSIAGIVAAMAGATVLIFGAQWLGERSQEQAAEATAERPYWKVHTATVAYEGGQPVRVEFVSGHVVGPDVPLADVHLHVAGQGFQWNATAVEITPLQDPDGSLARGQSSDGDLWTMAIALDGRPWPPAQVLSITWDLDGEAVADDLVRTSAPLPSGVRSVDLS